VNVSGGVVGSSVGCCRLNVLSRGHKWFKDVYQ